MDIKENVIDKLVNETIFSIKNISYKNKNLSLKLKEEMMEDPLISGALNLIYGGISSKEWIIASEDSEKQNKALEIQTRLNNINFNQIIEQFLNSEVYGHVIFEIIYNKWDIKDIVLMPYDIVDYDYKTGFKLKVSNEEIIVNDNPEKFLVSSYKSSIKKPMGSSILEPIIKYYLPLQSLEEKLNGIVNVYGEVITVIPYEAPKYSDSEPEKKQKLARAKKQGEELKNVKSKQVIMVPLGAGQSLKDNIHFITLSDLKVEVHEKVMHLYENKIREFLLGGTLNTTNGDTVGSYNLGAVHKEQQETIEKSKIKAIREFLQQLLVIDSKYYGYNPNDFYFKFTKETNEIEDLGLEEKKQDVKAKKMDNLGKLSTLGYTVSRKIVAEILEVEETEILEAPAQGYSGLEFSKTKIKKNIAEIVKAKSKGINNFLLSIESKAKSFRESYYNALKKELANINKIEDFKNLDIKLDYNLSNSLVFSHIKGYLDEQTFKKLKEFSSKEDIDIYNVESAEAINYLSVKYPTLFKEIESIVDLAREKAFWVKKITDVEITNKLLKHLQYEIKNGGTFQDWKKNVDTVLKDVGLSSEGYYLSTVYNTNMSQAYNGGVYSRQKELMTIAPYLYYSGIIDGNQQEHTDELNGKVFRLDDPMVDEIYPPNGYNCRCVMVQFDQEELSEYGISYDENEDISYTGNDFNGTGVGKKSLDNFKRSYNEKQKTLTENIKELE